MCPFTFARQTGKTFTATLEMVLDCLDAESRGERRRRVILSRGERQAKEAVEEGVKRHLQALKIAFEALEKDWDAHTKALEITLPGGSRITALPANPDTARGFSANVLLDEFAFHSDSRKIWQALFLALYAAHTPVLDFSQIQSVPRNTPIPHHAGWGTVPGARVTDGW